MKLKKYNEYVKEELTPMAGELEPLEVENEMPELDSELEVDQDENEMPDSMSDSDMGTEEEEGHEYEGTKLMSELAQKLGTKITDNSIVYKKEKNDLGKKINFFSETESFHVDNKKFKTIDEVLEYLGVKSDN